MSPRKSKSLREINLVGRLTFFYRFLRLQGADKPVLVDMVRTNNPRLWQALPRFAENIHRILRGEEIGFELLQELR